MTTYTPHPLDTSDVVLPETLLDLLERLAENTHDVWAAQRISDGWTYGSKRDDANKKHPCLVPYADLPEAEKEYDRKTAGETLKAVLAMGYTVSPPTHGAEPR
ncbi:MAG: RyR domain-containing protein [Planctomycetaceae bacterium]